MPIVKKERKTQVKVVIDDSVLAELDEYVNFVNALHPDSTTKVHKSHVVETAIRRLLKQDNDWQMRDSKSMNLIT